MNEKNPSCEKYDSFPLRIVIIRALLIAAWFITGIFIMLSFNIVLAVGFLVFGIVVIIAIMAFACRYCTYYGKFCDNGLSKLASFMFKKDVNKRKFAVNGSKFFIPLLILALIPLIGGVWGVFSNTKLLLLLIIHMILLGLVIVTTPILACRHCRMSDICPFCMLKRR